MTVSYDDLIEESKKKNMRLSYQRMKVMEYLSSHLIHPTAEQIYAGLREEIPTLSKTTVYSTLNALVDAGLVRIINIEDNEIRYDIKTENHGHFKCKSCGAIYDFNVDIDSLTTGDLQDFDVNDKNVYFKGTCPACSEKKH